MEAVLLVPDLKNTVKWTLVLIYGRFYITDYYQVKILFESHMRMVFNAVTGEKNVFLFFRVSEETNR